MTNIKLIQTALVNIEELANFGHIPSYLGHLPSYLGRLPSYLVRLPMYVLVPQGPHIVSQLPMIIPSQVNMLDIG